MMLAYLVLLLELFNQGTTPVETGLKGGDNSAEQCRGCHEAVYAEWRGSRHSQAWTSDFFQYDYRQQKRQWCRNCHIPMTAQQKDDETALSLRSEGINCITCHVRGDAFYSKTKSRRSPHNTTPSDTFGSPEYCAGCHQFNFPRFDEHGELLGFTEEPMQNTAEQYRAGPFAKTHTCTDCHSSPAKHSFAGSHDLSMLKRALAIDLCREGQAIVSTLTNQGAGHNVPTGDVHRHVLVRAWRSNEPARLQEAFYGRRFGFTTAGGKQKIWDSTLPPNTFRRWKLDAKELGTAFDEPINIEVRYVYGGHESYRPPFKEPAYQVVFRERKKLGELPACE